MSGISKAGTRLAGLPDRNGPGGRAVVAAKPVGVSYGQRFWVETPHPLITRSRLRAVLAPEAGERVLEVGPGTGYYSLDVAEWIGPGGQLDVFDLQQEMLDHTLERAGGRGIANIVASQGDARRLPYADAEFDAAFLVAVLGEIPDPDAALSELARVLKPRGRLVVGELFGDPHWVRPRVLHKRATEAGLVAAERSGSWLSSDRLVQPGADRAAVRGGDECPDGGERQAGEHKASGRGVRQQRAGEGGDRGGRALEDRERRAVAASRSMWRNPGDHHAEGGPPFRRCPIDDGGVSSPRRRAAPTHARSTPPA